MLHDCRASRRRSRKLARWYRRTQSDADRLEWIQRLKVMHQLYEGKNHQHWRLRIADSKGSMKKLWRTLSSVLGTTRSSAASLRHNADDFAKFFQRRFAAFELRQRPQSRILIKSQLDHHATSTYGRQYRLVILKSLLELLITRRVSWILPRSGLLRNVAVW